MSKKPLEAALKDKLNRMSSLPGDQIDTVDTHETSPEAWLHARRPGLYKPVKKPVTLRLDADVVAWFKAHAEGRGYQTEINRVLRLYITETRAGSLPKCLIPPPAGGGEVNARNAYRDR